MYLFFTTQPGHALSPLDFFFVCLFFIFIFKYKMICSISRGLILTQVYVICEYIRNYAARSLEMKVCICSNCFLALQQILFILS